MNVHEFQAKKILAKYELPIPEFGIASSTEEAKKIVEDLGLSEGIVKIQVHAGGRGKAGGVKFAKSPEEIIERAKELIGMKMVNNQTGADGVIAHQVMIARPVDIAKEYYLGAIVDREKGCAVLIASPEGGMEIEEIAAKTPEKILTLPIPFDGNLRRYHLINLANFMGWKGESAKQGMHIGKALAKAFMESDGSLLEINPLVETPDGMLWVVDAKLGVDENALYRQKEIAEMYDPTQVPDNEATAMKYNLAYIDLEGNIGCMVNGAGLAMATMDTIHYYGGKPANFLDVGGSADKEKVAAGLKIILSDPHVKAILVNIFGGIMSCATIAEGVVAAAKEIGITVPLVVRLEGTDVERGKEILSQSDVSIIAADSLSDAAKKSVECLG